MPLRRDAEATGTKAELMVQTNDNDDPSFGDFLRKQRVAAGLTQVELAERAGLSVRGISDLERGTRSVPRTNTLELLIAALQLPPPAQEALRWAAHRFPSRRPSLIAARKPPRFPSRALPWSGASVKPPWLSTCYGRKVSAL